MTDEPFDTSPHPIHRWVCLHCPHQVSAMTDAAAVAGLAAHRDYAHQSRGLNIQTFPLVARSARGRDGQA